MEPGASVQCGGLNFTTSDFYALPTFLSPDTEHRCPETCRESTTPPRPVFQPNYYRRPGCLSFLVSYLHTRSFLAVLHLRWLQNHSPVRPLVDPRVHRQRIKASKSIVCNQVSDTHLLIVYQYCCHEFTRCTLFIKCQHS